MFDPYITENQDRFKEDGADCFACLLSAVLITVCHDLFSLPLVVIGRTWSVIAAIPGHFFLSIATLYRLPHRYQNRIWHVLLQIKMHTV